MPPTSDHRVSTCPREWSCLRDPDLGLSAAIRQSGVAASLSSPTDLKFLGPARQNVKVSGLIRAVRVLRYGPGAQHEQPLLPTTPAIDGRTENLIPLTPLRSPPPGLLNRLSSLPAAFLSSSSSRTSSFFSFSKVAAARSIDERTLFNIPFALDRHRYKS